MSPKRRPRQTSRTCVSPLRHARRFELLEARAMLTASVAGAVWNDLDGDGRWSAAEPAAEGVRLDLFAADGAAIGQATSSADGSYSFPDLLEGDYRLGIERPDGFRLTNSLTGAQGSAFDRQSTQTDVFALSDGSIVSGVLGGLVELPRIEWSVAPVEEGQAAMVTLQLDREPLEPITLGLEAVTGLASPGADYSLGAGALTFAPGAPLSQTLSLLTFDDLNVEGDEAAELTLAPGLADALWWDGEAIELAVRDNDLARLSFDSASLRFAEDVGQAIVGVRLELPEGGQLERDVSLAVRDAGQGAAGAGDWSWDAGDAIAFAAGSTSGVHWVPLTVFDDANVEGSETFTLALANLLDGTRGQVTLDEAGSLLSGVIEGNDTLSVALNGLAPQLFNSKATLRLDLNEAAGSYTVDWISSDSALTVLSTGTRTPTSSHFVGGPNDPSRFVFQVAVGGGRQFSGDVLLDDYLRGVIDVTWSGLHLRYLVDSEYVPTGPLSDPELELFAKDFAYRTNLDAVTRVWGYRVDATYDDNQTGFDAYGFVRGDSPPVLAIRGTEPNTIQDVLADLNPLGVGFNQFDANRTAVVNWLNTAAAASGKAPIITGHSLGGALVQLMASYYTQQAATNLLTTVVTFNSAGVSTPWVVGYKPNQVAGGTRHYVVAGDIVSMAGNGFLPGSYQAVYQSYPSFLDQVNPLNKHTKPILVAMIGDNLKPTTAIVAHPNVNWLNSPWFCYDVPEHYALIAALTVAAAPLGLANLPPVLVFRGSSEATRVNLGSDLQQILNQIEFADDGAVLSFTVTVPKIDITLFGFAVLRLDNIQVRYQANPQPLLYMQGRVILPGFGGLGADFTGANYIRITGTGLELQGSLTNGFLPLVNDWFFNQLNVSFDQPNQKLTASGVMAFGPFDTVKLPIYLGGGTLSGRLVTANFNGMITPTAVMGTSNVSVFGGWAQGGTVSLNVDLVNQALTLDGSMSFLSGGVVATATITGDTSFNIMASGEATVIYPFSPFTGTTLGSGQFIFKYSHNNTLADDFVEGTGTNLGVTIGVRVYLNGRVVPIGRISLFAAPETSSVADDPQPTLALSRKETPRLDSEKDLALAAAFGDARLDSARTGRRSPALRRLAVLDEAFALAAVEDFPEQY